MNAVAVSAYRHAEVEHVYVGKARRLPHHDAHPAVAAKHAARLNGQPRRREHAGHRVEQRSAVGVGKVGNVVLDEITQLSDRTERINQINFVAASLRIVYLRAGGCKVYRRYAGMAERTAGRRCGAVCVIGNKRIVYLHRLTLKVEIEHA